MRWYTLSYAPMRILCAYAHPMTLSTCYSMPGTDTALPATPRPTALCPNLQKTFVEPTFLVQSLTENAGSGR